MRWRKPHAVGRRAPGIVQVPPGGPARRPPSAAGSPVPPVFRSPAVATPRRRFVPGTGIISGVGRRPAIDRKPASRVDTRKSLITKRAAPPAVARCRGFWRPRRPQVGARSALPQHRRCRRHHDDGCAPRHRGSQCRSTSGEAALGGVGIRWWARKSLKAFEPSCFSAPAVVNISTRRRAHEQVDAAPPAAVLLGRFYSVDRLLDGSRLPSGPAVGDALALPSPGWAARCHARRQFSSRGSRAFQAGGSRLQNRRRHEVMSARPGSSPRNAVRWRCRPPVEWWATLQVGRRRSMAKPFGGLSHQRRVRNTTHLVSRQPITASRGRAARR